MAAPEIGSTDCFSGGRTARGGITVAPLPWLLILIAYTLLGLLFTSQVWNLTFAWYQSLRTVPGELREAGRIFQLHGLLRLTTIELPFAAIALIWNSMMSWAGGWFFLMAAEIFTVGQRDFRLPGLGAYLSEAASMGNLRAIGYGVATLILVIVALDQFLWRSLLASIGSKSSSSTVPSRSVRGFTTR